MGRGSYRTNLVPDRRERFKQLKRNRDFNQTTLLEEMEAACVSSGSPANVQRLSRSIALRHDAKLRALAATLGVDLNSRHGWRDAFQALAQATLRTTCIQVRRKSRKDGARIWSAERTEEVVRKLSALMARGLSRKAAMDELISKNLIPTHARAHGKHVRSKEVKKKRRRALDRSLHRNQRNARDLVALLVGTIMSTEELASFEEEIVFVMLQAQWRNDSRQSQSLFFV